MDPITISLLVGGGLKAWNAWDSASKQQDEEKKRRQAYQNQIGELNKFKSELIGEQRSSGTDMMTNYITTKDNQKASGIANMYLQKYSDFKSSLRNTDAEIRQNQSAMDSVPTTTNADKWSGLLGAAVETGGALYGQYASAVEGINNANTLTTLNNSLLGEKTPESSLKQTPGFGEFLGKGILGETGYNKVGNWIDSAKDVFGGNEDKVKDLVNSGGNPWEAAYGQNNNRLAQRYTNQYDPSLPYRNVSSNDPYKRRRK